MSKLNDFDDVMGSLSVIPAMVKVGVIRLETVNNGATVDFISTMKDGTRNVQSGPKEFSAEGFDRYTPPMMTFMNFLLDMLNEEQVDATVPA